LSGRRCRRKPSMGSNGAANSLNQVISAQSLLINRAKAFNGHKSNRFT
jgi:hypothetical protein